MNKFDIEFTVIEETFGQASFKGPDMTEEEALDLVEDYIVVNYPKMTEFTIDRVKGVEA